MLMSSGLNYGVKRTMAHFLGVILGFPVFLLLTGLGLESYFQHYPLLHQSIKTAGALYILYLAWDIAMSHPPSDPSPAAKPLTFTRALLFQWMNPKAWALGVTSIFAYTTINNHIPLQISIICLMRLLIVIPCCGIWLLFGSSLAKLLKHPQHQKICRYILGGLLALSVGLIFI